MADRQTGAISCLLAVITSRTVGSQFLNRIIGYNETMHFEEVIKQGWISVGDDIPFDYHIEVLRLFGRELGAHMQATYRLDDDWRIWFPKLYGNHDFKNELSTDGNTFEMNQLLTSQLVSQKIFPEDEPGQRIIFAHNVDPKSNKKYYKFVGVFSELKGNMKHASCQRTADILYIDGKGRFSTEPLVKSGVANHDGAQTQP